MKRYVEGAVGVSTGGRSRTGMVADRALVDIYANLNHQLSLTLYTAT